MATRCSGSKLEADAAVGDGDAGIEQADVHLLAWRRRQREEIVETNFAAHVLTIGMRGGGERDAVEAHGAARLQRSSRVQ